MKKLVFALLSISLFMSCGEEQEVATEQNTEQKNSIDIEKLSDRELFEYAEMLEKKLIDQESLEISKKNSVKLLEASQKHIEKFPESQFRREIMRKGSRAAQGLNQDFEAVRILNLTIKENEGDSTIVDEMNVRAYLYDKMEDKEKAKAAYEEIIEKFPNHPSVANHIERLKTIHMSTEELLEYFEKKNAE